jgi:hypothetical protein
VARQLFPVEHRFLDLDGALIHYVDEGTIGVPPSATPRRGARIVGGSDCAAVTIALHPFWPSEVGPGVWTIAVLPRIPRYMTHQGSFLCLF